MSGDFCTLVCGRSRAVWPSSAAIIVAMFRCMASTSTTSAGVGSTSTDSPTCRPYRSAIRSLARSHGSRQSLMMDVQPGYAVGIQGHGRGPSFDCSFLAAAQEAFRIHDRSLEGVLVQLADSDPVRAARGIRARQSHPHLVLVAGEVADRDHR